MNPNEATIQLDSEPLSSGDCRNDLASYRRELRQAHADITELDARPEWGSVVGGWGLALLVGILLGALSSKLPAHED